jgi:hypothetical protein
MVAVHWQREQALEMALEKQMAARLVHNVAAFVHRWLSLPGDSD